jgi:hypothetical protein
MAHQMYGITLTFGSSNFIHDDYLLSNNWGQTPIVVLTGFYHFWLVHRSSGKMIPVLLMHNRGQRYFLFCTFLFSRNAFHRADPHSGFLYPHPSAKIVVFPSSTPS